MLTTHHLEEAEELSQTIGIMSEGKMMIVGTSDYIKEKFNVGFHAVLGFTEANKNMMEDCRKLVLELIPSAKEDTQTAYNTLKYLLPQN